MQMTKKAEIPAATRAIVLARHAACVVCGDRQANECGHIIAEACGGAATEGNLLRMCGACNRAQGKKNVAFAAYAKPISLKATYGEALATLDSRRAAWAAYLKRAEHGELGRMARPYRPT
jgi:hypothetical protein